MQRTGTGHEERWHLLQILRWECMTRQTKVFLQWPNGLWNPDWINTNFSFCSCETSKVFGWISVRIRSFYLSMCHTQLIRRLGGRPILLSWGHRPLPGPPRTGLLQEGHPPFRTASPNPAEFQDLWKTYAPLSPWHTNMQHSWVLKATNPAWKFLARQARAPGDEFHKEGSGPRNVPLPQPSRLPSTVITHVSQAAVTASALLVA